MTTLHSAPQKPQPVYLFGYGINAAILGAIFILAILFFYPSLHTGFLYDDWGDLRNAYGPFSNLANALLPTNGGWRAVTMIFWRLSYELFGANPFGFHVLVLTIHLGVIFLVWLLARTLSKNDYVALLAAFLFSINKITITPVAWISASIDQKLLMFALIACLCYLQAANHVQKKQKGMAILWIVIFNVAAWLTFKSKLMAWTMPAIYFCIDFFYCNLFSNIRARFLDSLKRWLLIIWPLITLTLIYIPFYFIEADGIPKTGEYSTSLSPLNFLKSLSEYLSSCFSFNGFYAQSAVRIVSLLIGAAILLYGCVFKNKNIIFGAVWFVITLTPVAILTKHHFDHHLYLPLFGLCFAVSALAFDIYQIAAKKRFGKGFISLLLLLCLLYPYAMYKSFRDWNQNTKDAWTLSRATLDSIKVLYPTIPPEISFFVYPRPKWSMLDYSGSLNFLYNQFDGISVSVFESEDLFQSAIANVNPKSNWAALTYNPADGTLKPYKGSLTSESQ